MGNSYSLKGQELDEVPNEIYLHDKTYVFNKKYTLNVKKEIIHEKKRFIFYDKNTSTHFLMFKPLPDFNEVYLCDMRNRPVLNMKDNREKKTSKIFIKDDNKKFRVKLKFGSDRVKVYFINKANGKKEVIQIKTNRKFTQIGIYYGVFEEQAPLIAKFYIKEKGLQVTKEYNFIYEISAGVDISFMAMLAIYLNRYRIYLAEKTSLYSISEAQPKSVSHSSSRSNESAKSANGSKKNLKIKHINPQEEEIPPKVENPKIESKGDSSIDDIQAPLLPQAADNKSTISVNSKKTPSEI